MFWITHAEIRFLGILNFDLVAMGTDLGLKLYVIEIGSWSRKY